jgi:hypothetical protein
LALLKSLPEDAWNRNGIHPEYGALELRQIVVHLVEHDRKHIDQAQRACAASLAKAKKKSAKKGSQKPQKKTKKTN